ncbi:HD domain-containing protein [Sphaerisporangium sp. NPDC088356]|uniref:HD domain-containing protein n=1 Tax=Sphaerisporangium sp. NPDC088356 TaxID=3154871 RepID=UPI0034134250
MAVEWASERAERQLRESLPRRWEHTKGIALRAGQLGPLAGDSAGVLQAAAYLHDIGYSPSLVRTEFHPLDGARYLRTLDVDDRVTRLVANHSIALLEAEERGLRAELASEFPLVEDPFLATRWCSAT